MYLKTDLSLVVTVVASGFSNQVMEAAKTAGAEGATIFNARGNGIHETDSILGVSIQPEKEVILIVVRKNIRKKVMREICKNSGLNEEGKGLVFSLPIDEIGGVSHLADMVRNPKKKPAPKQTQKTATKAEPKQEQKTQEKTTESTKTKEEAGE